MIGQALPESSADEYTRERKSFSAFCSVLQQRKGGRNQPPGTGMEKMFGKLLKTVRQCRQTARRRYGKV